MPFGVDFPNLTNPYTQIDQYYATGSVSSTPGYYPNGALNVPGSVFQMPGQIFSQYAGFNSNYAPAQTVLGTTATSVNVTAVNNTSELQVGMSVTGSGVAAGTTIVAIPTSTTITLSLATTSGVTLNQLTCFFGTNVFNGFPPILKYVRYSSQNNPALLAYPAVVYYTDSTGTTVSGYVNEAYGVGTNNTPITVANQCAGVLLPNTTTGATAASLNGNWCWIAVGGVVPGVAAAASAVIGDLLYAAVTTTDAFTVVRAAAGTASLYQRYLGTAWSNLSTNTTCDVLLNPSLAVL